ncbi:lipoprotein [Streptomyces marokkonensis]|uniref:Lipoprotein n=1 Tax=Streptomyces marokkonensis TaxID=324855 RepID=A0ABP7QLE6_9ACTN
MALAGVSALVLAGGAVGCGAEKKDGASGADRSVQQVLTAAYEKTSEAKSANVEMTMSMPAALDGGGDVTMSGVMGWDPTVMDVTMKGSMLATEPDAPEQVRMVWRDNVMYMDMGEAAAKDMDGKRWMKMDLAAAAESAGAEAGGEMLSGLENMNQSPVEQLALLLESPNLKRVGEEKVDGVTAQHYKGTLTVKEMMESNESLDVLEPKEREQLLKNVEKSGIKGYDTEVWVNDDDLPVRMDVGMDTPQGNVDMSMKLSDYGAKAEVEVPPAADTFDLFEMLKKLGEMSGDEAAFEEEMAELEALESGSGV